MNSDEQSPTQAYECRNKDERIDFICEMMRTLDWKTGKTGKELAKVWGVSPSTVRDYAADASRRVRSEVTDPESVSRDVCSALRIAVSETLDKKDWGRMTKAAEVWASISGAKAAERVDMRSVHTEVTPDEARRIMADKFGKLTPEKDEPTEE